MALIEFGLTTLAGACETSRHLMLLYKITDALIVRRGGASASESGMIPDMEKSGLFGKITYWTDGKGKHTFEAMTQKPFSQFKDEVNQGLENSWASAITKWSWTDQTCHVITWGGDAIYKLENGKASIQLAITGSRPPSFTSPGCCRCPTM